jgi:hypothetical protein
VKNALAISEPEYQIEQTLMQGMRNVRVPVFVKKGKEKGKRKNE